MGVLAYVSSSAVRRLLLGACTFALAVTCILSAAPGRSQLASIVSLASPQRQSHPEINTTAAPSAAPTKSPTLPAHLTADEKAWKEKLDLATTQVAQDHKLFLDFHQKLQALRQRSKAVSDEEVKVLKADTSVLNVAKMRFQQSQAQVKTMLNFEEKPSVSTDAEAETATKAAHLARQAQLDMVAAKVALTQGQDELKEAKGEKDSTDIEQQAQRMIAQAQQETAASKLEKEQSLEMYQKAMGFEKKVSAESKGRTEALNLLNEATRNDDAAQHALSADKAKYSNKLVDIASTENLMRQEIGTARMQIALDTMREDKVRAHLTRLVETTASPTARTTAPTRPAPTAATPPARKAVSSSQQLQRMDSAPEAPAAAPNAPVHPKTYDELRAYIRNRDHLLAADGDVSVDLGLPEGSLKSALPVQFGA